LPVPGGGEEDGVVLAGDEVEGAEMRDDVALEPTCVVEVELLDRLAGREAGGADAAFAAVVLPRGDLALQAGGEELLMRPVFRSRAFGEPLHRVTQRGCLQGAGEVGELGGGVTGRRLGRGGGHQATVPSTSSRPSAVS
jgi:hypothetical protein